MTKRFDNFFLLTVILGLVFGAMGMSIPLATLFLEGLGAGFGRISLILASSAAVGLVGSYVWGRLSDRLGRRKLLIVAGLAGMAMAYALLSRALSPAQAWGARLWEGVVQGAYFTISLAMMGDVLAQRGDGGRGKGMGGYRGVGSVTFAIGALIGGRLADRFSLNLVFGLTGAVYVVAALIALALHESPIALATPAADVSSIPEKASHRSSSLPLAFLGGVFVWTTALSAFSSVSSNYLARLGYSKSAITSLWALAALVEAPVMRWVGQLSDVVGRAPVLAFGSLVMALTMIGFLTLAASLAALVGIQMVRGVSYGSLMATSMVYAAEAGDRRTRGHNSGLYTAATAGGQLMGLLLGGTLVQARGFEFLFWVCAAGAVASGVCFWLLPRREAE